MARAQMRAAGALQGEDQMVQTERGARDFAGGDRIMFLRNERGLGAAAAGRSGGRDGVAVKNGTLGAVLEVAAKGERLTVRLDRGRADGKAGEVVTFDVREYGHVDHGDASTVHKAQGVTVDRAHVLATPIMDRHAAYVGLTRHRESVALHYGADDFADAGKLARALGRERAKDTTLDYGMGQNAGQGAAQGEAADLEAAVRRYAERRGLDPLRPESAIVVRAEREAPIATPEPRKRPSRSGVSLPG
jgi:ATP-dependent exoDNAse (exonuclease V) alpha subunit